jgi:hypothetical protein
LDLLVKTLNFSFMFLNSMLFFVLSSLLNYMSS